MRKPLSICLAALCACVSGAAQNDMPKGDEAMKRAAAQVKDFTTVWPAQPSLDALDASLDALEGSMNLLKEQNWGRVFNALDRDMALLTKQVGGAKWTLGFAPLAAQPYDERGRSAEAEADRYYERGQRALDRQRWDEARDNFTEASTRGGPRADGALYWKAYSENKLGRRDDAMATLAQLRKNYASSRWLDDAKALELEVQQASGRPVTPETTGDEELKLMALNGLMNSDPERAMPMLEKLLQSTQSPKVKERALFVLTQSGSPSARKLVVQVAKGGSNPDLQMKAVHYLGVMGARQDLGDVYAATNDVAVKRAVLQGLMVAGAREQLLNAAKSEKNPDLRRVAIHQLGVSGGMTELWQLYQTETVPEVKKEIIRALFVGGSSDRLLEIARTAKEPDLRREAIRSLGNMGAEHSGDALAAMYTSDTDQEVRKEIIRSLFVQGNARALVAAGRKETDPEMKKQIVRNLSNMHSKDATDYLMELLNK
jgi:HEAT repeat protein